MNIDLERDGPARFDVLVLEGAYRVQVASLEEGRVLHEFSQDVLPRAIKDLGVVHTSAEEFVFDLSVRRVQGQIGLGDAAQPVTDDEPRAWQTRPMLRLTPDSGDLTYPLWAELSDEGRFELLVYEGSYNAELALRSGFGWDTEQHETIGPFGQTWLGHLCVDQASPRP